MKNDDAFGMGCFLVAMLNSERRLGRAEGSSRKSSESTQNMQYGVRMNKNNSTQ